MIRTLLASFAVSALMATAATAQVNGPGPSDPNDFDRVFNLPADQNTIDGFVGVGNRDGATARTTQLNFARGGRVSFNFNAFSGSEVNIRAGSVGSHFTAFAGSEVNISGGTLGGGFGATPGSEVQLIGGEFELNGVPATGSTITLNSTLGPIDVFTGTLADGSSFIFSPQAGDNLNGVTLTTVRLPPSNAIPRVVNTDISAAGPSGLRRGRGLTLQTGGVLGNNFAVVDARLIIEDGAIGFGLEIRGTEVEISGGTVGGDFNAFSGSEVSVLGGTVGSGFNAFSGSEVSVLGGTVGSGFNAFSGSNTNISGGSVGSLFEANSGSVVEISGGSVGSSFNAFSGSEVNISGGTFGDLFNARSGSEVNIGGGNVGNGFHSESGSMVELIGGEFELNGAPFSGATITLDDTRNSTDVFTGTLADGSSFVFSALPRAVLFRGDILNGVKLTEAPLPAPNVTAQVVNTDISATSPSGLRSGQTLTLQTGGVLGDNFAVVDATLNIEGGIVGQGLEPAGAEVNISGGSVGHFSTYPGSVVNISGGSLPRGFTAYSRSVVNVRGGNVGSFSARLGSVVNISGGTVGFFSGVGSGSVVNISGGTVGSDFGAADSVVNISGGTVGSDFRASDGSVINISGGDVTGTFQARSGSVVNIRGGAVDRFDARSGSEVNLFGTEFFLHGVLLNALALGDPFTITSRGRAALLSGTLADGSAFSFTLRPSSFDLGSTLTVTLVPEPSSVLLLLVACGGGSPRRRSSAGFGTAG